MSPPSRACRRVPSALTPASDRDAQNAEALATGALAAVRRHYPEAMTTDAAVHALLELLAAECGRDPQRVLLADSVCSDDVNSVEYPERARAKLGPFRLGGLDGFPHAGLTGMGAFAAHVPDDGGIVILPALRPGRRVIRVFNAGPQAHELVMVRLRPGRTAHDAAAWAERGQTGEAPGAMIGGVAALTPGRVAQCTVDVTPGEYAFICFVPDQRDGAGRAHVAHGMVRQLTVRSP